MRLAGKIAVITGRRVRHRPRDREAVRCRRGNGDRRRSRPDGAARVAREIEAQGGKAVPTTSTSPRRPEVKALIETAAEAHGRLDILVNNAGYGFAGTVVTTSEKDWDALMAVNVKGVFFGCKYAIPIMERQGGGAIVNTASGAPTSASPIAPLMSPPRAPSPH